MTDRPYLTSAFGRIAACAYLLAAGVLLSAFGQAAPAFAQPVTAFIERQVSEGAGLSAVYVYSPAMRESVKVQVYSGASNTGPRPTLYFLSGLGEEDPGNSMWLHKSPLREFYADKNVSVVMPLAGNGSFYTDWKRDDPKLGRYQWETFLTEELPPLIEAEFDGSGKRGIAGLSMGAGAGLLLAARNPGVYAAVAAYSGCYSSRGVAGQLYPRSVIAGFGGDADNMWGGPNDPEWARHDILGMVENLRGTTLYVSTGTGRAGPYDQPGYPGNSNPIDRQLIGGGIELGALWCTSQLDSALAAKGIAADIRYVDPATHSWPYWIDQQRESWPILAAAMA